MVIFGVVSFCTVWGFLGGRFLVNWLVGLGFFLNSVWTWEAGEICFKIHNAPKNRFCAFHLCYPDAYTDSQDFLKNHEIS